VCRGAVFRLPAIRVVAPLDAVVFFSKSASGRELVRGGAGIRKGHGYPRPSSLLQPGPVRRLPISERESSLAYLLGWRRDPGARCAAGTSSRRRPPALQVGRVRWNLKSMGRSVHRCLPRVSARDVPSLRDHGERSSRPTVPASRPSRRTRARSTPAESSAATASAHDSPVPRKTGTGWASCTAVNSGPFACALACRVSRLTTPSTSETAAGRPPLPRQYHWNGGRPAHAAGRYVQCPLDRRGG